MVLTEEQAKQMWCPFARTTESGKDGSTNPRNRVANRDTMEVVERLLGASCIGSACMAWRKMPDDFDRVFVPALADGWGPSPGPEWVLSTTAHASDRNGPGQYWAKRRDDRGYCGLAGRPE